MLGEKTVEVNGMCLNPSTTYVLMIEQREVENFLIYLGFFIKSPRHHWCDPLACRTRQIG